MLAPLAEDVPGDRAQRAVDPVDALVLQDVVDELAVHLAGVGEEQLQHGLELAPAARLDEAVEVVAVDLLAQARGRHERQRGRAGRVAQGDARGHEPAERVAHEVRALAGPGCRGTARPRRRGSRGRRAHVLGRAAVARQLERVHRVALGQRRRREEPVVEVAAEAVQEHDRRRRLALAQEAQGPGGDRDGLRRGPGVLLALAGDERGLELLDEGVDRRRRGRPRRRSRQQPADRDGVADARPRAGAGRPATGRLDRAVELVGLDLGHLVADGDLGALVDEPIDEAALGHRQAPLGHAQLLDASLMPRSGWRPGHLAHGRGDLARASGT